MSPDEAMDMAEMISSAFSKAVDAIGLNAGITDSRMKVVFHSLRHTYASWLVEKGVDLYTVKELIGHSSLSMTERYSHVGENAKTIVVRKLDKIDLNLNQMQKETE
jgi:site-specific recombinase XerD